MMLTVSCQGGSQLEPQASWSISCLLVLSCLHSHLSLWSTAPSVSPQLDFYPHGGLGTTVQGLPSMLCSMTSARGVLCNLRVPHWKGPCFGEFLE